MFSLERALIGFAAAVGDSVSRRPAMHVVGSLVAFGLLAVGILLVEVESDVFKLWVDDSTNIKEQMDHYDDAYGFARVQSVILTAKENKTLASKEAFEEMEALEKWFVSVEYDHVGEQYSGKVKYENLCYKVVDTTDETPCFHLTPLDCFKQGMQSLPGLTNNTKYTQSYTSRADFSDESQFDFGTDFTKAFIDDSCKEWYNVQTPLKMIFGGTTDNDEGDSAVVSSLGAMRNVFATRTAEKLAERGVLTTEWLDSGDVETDILGCPLDVTAADCSCVDSFAITSVAAYGCSPNGGSQPATCCDDFMEPFSTHPCARYLYQRNPSASAIGSLILTSCGLPAIDMGTSDCHLQPDGVTKYQQPYTGYDTTKTAEECQVIMSDAELTAACDDFENSYENATKCCAMVYDASKQMCHCRYLDTTPEQAYFSTFGKNFETYAGKCLKDDESYEACPLVPPPPSPPPPGEGYSCIGSLNDYLTALQLAMADPSNQANGLAMCTLAQAYYGNYCMCDANVIAAVTADPALASATSDLINQGVASSCGTVNIAVRAHACASTQKTQHDTCASNYDDYRTKCLTVLGTVAAGGTPTGGELSSCCNAANVMAADACPCVNVDDGYGVDRSISSTSDIRLSFILNAPGQGCVDVLGSAGFTANTYTCTSPPSPPPSPPPRDPTYTLPRHVRHPVDESEAESILEGWEKAWLDGIEEATKDFEHIDVTWYAARSLEDVITDASRSAYGFIAIGYALVVVFCFVFFIEGLFAQRGKPPGPVPAILATIVCILSTAASLGFAAFYVEAGLKFNAMTLQVVPFLALGLGMNDYFVFAKYVGISHAESPKGSSAQYIIRKAYRKAGASITASSVTNFAAFCLGAITPIPAVRAFSIQVAMTVVCNYIAAVVIFPCLLLFDLQRHVNANPDAVGNRGHSTKKEESNSKDADSSSCVRCLGALASFIFRLACVLLSAGFFVFCAVGIDKVKLGLDLQDVVPSSSYIYDYALNTRDYFATYQVSLVSTGVNFATTTKNQALLEHDFVTAPNVNVDYGSVNYLRYFADETTGKVSGGEVCGEDVVWLYDYINLSDESLEECASINSDATLTSSEQKLKCFRTCMNAEPQMAYAPTTHNPNVTEASQTYRCSYNATNNHCVCPWRQVYKPSLYNQNLQTFLDGGERGQISQTLMVTNSTPTDVGYTTISNVRAIFYVEDVFTLEDKLNHIRNARKIVENSTLVTEDGATVYPFDYSLYALNEQYLNIEKNTIRGLGISVAISFVVMYPFVTSLWLDVILTFVIAVIQIELYGLIHWIELKLNAVTMVNLIMTVGISIEFVIHEARAFAEAKGTRPQRAAQALSEMGPAIFASAFTTFLAILPIVGADYEYFQMYFFRMYAMILFVGLFNSLVTLPAILSFIGPPELIEDAVHDSEVKLDEEMV